MKAVRANRKAARATRTLRVSLSARGSFHVTVFLQRPDIDLTGPRVMRRLRDKAEMTDASRAIHEPYRGGSERVGIS